MRTVKLVVIGASGVGKTSLRNQYISGRFTTGYRATIGADFITKTLAHHANQEEKVTLQIWDTAGQERFSSLSSAFFRGADAVVLIFDVNQPQTLDALTKWWNEFRDRAPVEDEEVNNFCCVFVGNKIDVPPTTPGIATPIRPGTDASRRRVDEMHARQFIESLIPPAISPPPSPLQQPTLSLKTPESLLETLTHSTLPTPTHSIDIAIYHRGRHSRSRSRSTLFRGGTVGTMTTTHTMSVYQTPSSSFFDAFETARSSPSQSCLHAPRPRSHSRHSSLSSSSPSPARRHTAPMPGASRSPSHSPIRTSTHLQTPHRKLSISSALSDAQTITPSLFVRDTRTSTTACTTPSPVRPSSSSSSPSPEPPEQGPKLFFTSAKTGEGVSAVFEYVARRVVARWEYEEAREARTMHVSEGSGAADTIRLTVAGGAQGQKAWCCKT